MYVVWYKYHILPTHLILSSICYTGRYIVDWVESIISLVVFSFRCWTGEEKWFWSNHEVRVRHPKVWVVHFCSSCRLLFCSSLLITYIFLHCDSFSLVKVALSWKTHLLRRQWWLRAKKSSVQHQQREIWECRAWRCWSLSYFFCLSCGQLAILLVMFFFHLANHFIR